MEIKVLIADDEAPIRDWIEYCIMQSGLPYSIVGLAANGSEALEFFIKSNPDVIITDIRMPIMDGIELIKEAKRLKQSVKTVILTCYSDFEYVRNALKCGADEYILKSEISKSIMYDLLKGIADKIERKDITATLNESKLLSRDLYLRSILTGGSNSDVTELTLQSYGIPLKEGSFFSAAVKPFDSIHDRDIEQKLYDFANNFTYFPYDTNIFILIVNTEYNPSELHQIDKINKFATYLRKYVGGTIGISKIYDRLSQLGEAMNESLIYLNQGFYNGEGSVNIALLSPVIQNASEQEEKFLILKRAVQSGGLREALEEIENHLEYIASIKMPDIKFLKQRYQNIVGFLYAKFAKETEDNAYLNEIIKEIDRCMSFKAFRDILRNFADLMIEHTESNKSYSVYIAKALEYINNNYDTIGGLTDVAKVVQLSAEYFSRLFKEETGCNFNTYLTSVRMKKAMQLLQTTTMRIYEVSEAVGYQNLSYFSRVFKKYYGANPFDYRISAEK